MKESANQKTIFKNEKNDLISAETEKSGEKEVNSNQNTNAFFTRVRKLPRIRI